MLKYLLMFSISILFYIYLVSFNNIYPENNLFFSLEEQPFNKTYSEWAHWWWQKHISIPNYDGNFHPRGNYNMEKCSLAQNGGPIWFLPDGKDKPKDDVREERTCIVPEGKSVMVQLIGSGCSTGEREVVKTEKGLRECADWLFKENNLLTDKYDFKVIFDGVKIMDSESNPSDRNKFYVDECRANLTYAFPSIYNVKEEPHPYIKDFTNDIPQYCNPDASGIFNATISGTYFISKPLKAGNHTLDIQTVTKERFFVGTPISERQTFYVYNLIVK
jgi:hypothetical protein